MLLLRSTGTVFPMNYRTYHILLLLNVDYIHICYHCNFFFLNLLLFVYYLFVLLFQLDAYKRPSFSTESINLSIIILLYYITEIYTVVCFQQQRTHTHTYTHTYTHTVTSTHTNTYTLQTPGVNGVNLTLSMS